MTDESHIRPYGAVIADSYEIGLRSERTDFNPVVFADVRALLPEIFGDRKIIVAGQGHAPRYPANNGPC